VFELVVAMNVFEHLREPHVASAELHRVLALGGKALIRTAFLQILHEEPNHFFGATEFGVRQWFRQFSAIDVQVSPNFNPFFGMAWMMHELLQAVEVSLGAESRKELENVTLGEVGARWPERVTTQSPVLAMLSRLPQEVQARFAAGFEMWATK
jgi:SAM-dependent methyltransferase